MRLCIVANKWWEAAPLVAALQHVNVGQDELSAAPTAIYHTGQPCAGGSFRPAPRLIARCNGADVEVWCVQDLMDLSENSSLTWEKARVLPRILTGDGEQVVVVAFGTAASPSGAGHDGNVVIGTSVFVHDPFENNEFGEKRWAHPQMNQIVASDLQNVFDCLSSEYIAEAERRLLTPVHGAAAPPRVFAGSGLISVGVVNVTDSADYSWTDENALRCFREVAKAAVTESLETTHGVVRLLLGSRFLYVSGIANAVGRFAEEVKGNPYRQNFVASHNAAVATAWLLPELVLALSKL
jgi:hypothetical protein